MKLDQNCPEITEVLRRVSYNPETGIFTALVRAGRRKPGDKCGYADNAGYVKLCFNGRWVMAHRLAWRIVHGEWPQGEIDHINGNPSDNRIDNLRVCTRSQNVMNTRRGNGVCWHKNRNRWQVIVKSGGKSYYFGCFLNRSEADAVAAKAIKKLHGEFANIAPPPPPPQQTEIDL